MPMVKMVHSSWKSSEKREPAVVERSMFDRVWKDKGWKLVKEGKVSSDSSSDSSSTSSSSSLDSGGSNK